MNDISKTIEPKSDQLNADDLISGPKTIVITDIKVDPTGGPQPVAIAFDGDNGKPYKPCKSMRRVMVQVWGKDGGGYIGRSMTLYLDPKVKFGGLEVGGIRISHMSDLKEKVSFALTASRARRVSYSVQPLATSPDTEALKASVDDAMKAAAGGRLSYSEWWKKQSQTTKQFHINGGHQARCIKAANAHDDPPKSQDESGNT